MYLSGKLNKGLAEKMDRKCGTNASSYPLVDKISDINSALERYFFLGLGFNVDDTNYTAQKTNTKTVTGAVGYYKISSLSDEAINILKVSVVDSVTGKETNLIEESLESLGDTLTNIYTLSGAGTPTHFLRLGDFIYFRQIPASDYSIRFIYERASKRFAFKAFTVTIASPGVFTSTAHGLAIGDTVTLSTDGILPTGLTAGNIYYVVSAGFTVDAFEISATLGGTAINTSGSQSGNHSFIKVNQEPGIPETFHDFLWHYASLQYCLDKALAQKEDLKQLVAVDELAIKNYFVYLNKDTRQSMTPSIEDCR